jgi:hypothetical protein
MGTLGVVGKTNAEEERVRFPWDFVRYEFRTDAHGAGKWRGAPGIVWEGVNEGLNAFLTADRGVDSPLNLRVLRRRPPPLNKAYILRGPKLNNQPHIPVDLKCGIGFNLKREAPV